jgi:hypothetical protein
MNTDLELVAGSPASLPSRVRHEDRHRAPRRLARHCPFLTSVHLGALATGIFGASGGTRPIVAGAGQVSALRFGAFPLSLELAWGFPCHSLVGNELRAGIAASPGAAARLPGRDSTLHAEVSGADSLVPLGGRESRDAAADCKGAQRFGTRSAKVRGEGVSRLPSLRHPVSRTDSPRLRGLRSDDLSLVLMQAARLLQ